MSDRLNESETESQLDRIEAKVDRILTFVDAVQQGLDAAMNAGGIQGAMLRSMLPTDLRQSLTQG